jgi:hypothetical protein
MDNFLADTWSFERLKRSCFPVKFLSVGSYENAVTGIAYYDDFMPPNMAESSDSGEKYSNISNITGLIVAGMMTPLAVVVLNMCLNNLRSYCFIKRRENKQSKLGKNNKINHLQSNCTHVQVAAASRSDAAGKKTLFCMSRSDLLFRVLYSIV